MTFLTSLFKTHFNIVLINLVERCHEKGSYNQFVFPVSFELLSVCALEHLRLCYLGLTDMWSSYEVCRIGIWCVRKVCLYMKSFWSTFPRSVTVWYWYRVVVLRRAPVTFYHIFWYTYVKRFCFWLYFLLTIWIDVLYFC